MGAAVEAPGKKRGARPDINITPLVDIVLVLLIIFMVITPQLEAGEAVDPPNVTNVDPSSKTKLDVLTLTYTHGGRYFVEKEQLASVEAFEQRLVAEHAKNPARRVMLKGDARTEYGRVRDVFQIAQRAGFKGISLVVAQKAGADASDPAYVAGVP